MHLPLDRNQKINDPRNAMYLFKRILEVVTILAVLTLFLAFSMLLYYVFTGNIAYSLETALSQFLSLEALMLFCIFVLLGYFLGKNMTTRNAVTLGISIFAIAAYLYGIIHYLFITNHYFDTNHAMLLGFAITFSAGFAVCFAGFVGFIIGMCIEQSEIRRKLRKTRQSQ